MTRREWLVLADPALPFGRKPLAAKSIRPPGEKGICVAAKKRSPHGSARFTEAVEAHWIYSWNIVPPEVPPAGVDFIPMINKWENVTDQAFPSLKSTAPNHGFRGLLGLNEPDAKTQGDISVENALAARPRLEATGLRLGRPACGHLDNEWITALVKGVEKCRLRVDFICMHFYGGPGVSLVVKRLEEVHALYNRLIWITGFAVADWDAKFHTENCFAPRSTVASVARLLRLLSFSNLTIRLRWLVRPTALRDETLDIFTPPVFT